MINNKKMSKKNNDIFLSTDDKLIYSIKKHINDDNFLKSKFYHKNNKYKIDDLLKSIIYILKTGVSYRNVNTFTENINWNTIYKFHCKLIKYNIINDTYQKCINKYLNELVKHTQILHTDTTFICNKLGSENISFNQQIKKHKTNKVSIITDDFNIPISVVTSTGATNDSLILNNQIDVLYENHPIIFNEDKIILADAAYDSSILRNKVKDLKLGKLITPINRRNSKITNKINLYDKMLLKKRISIEHTINKYKQFKRCQLRYDKYIKTFNSFISMASLLILIRRSDIYLD